MFPKENTTDSVSDNVQKDLPSDGKYEGFADVNDVIISELKNLLSTEGSKGTTDNVVSLDRIPTILILIIRILAIMQESIKNYLLIVQICSFYPKQLPSNQILRHHVKMHENISYTTTFMFYFYLRHFQASYM